jgi:hypothetical protein
VLPVQIPSDSRLISMWPPSISLALQAADFGESAAEQGVSSRPDETGLADP